jgi:tetratricopeptide (TPR) repeat protein
MRTVIRSYNPGGIDEAVLEETGRGGLLSDGSLRDDPLESYVGDDETPVFVRSNAKKGISFERLDSGETGRIVPGSGYRTFLLVTDTRLVFVVGDNQKGDEGDCSVVVPLSDVELVESTDGLMATTLVVTTLTDVRWQFPCRDDIADVLAYLETASEAWKRVETRLDEARRLVVDATQYREDHEYDEAMGAIEDAAAATAAARECETEFVSSGVPAMDTRIARTEERITDERLRTLRARATRNLDRAEQLWRRDDYNEAHESFVDAHGDYVTALDVQDAGFEDSASIRKKLARVERNLAALERAPVERGDLARERADETDDPVERGDLLERALERYRRALELDWGDEHKRFVGDTDEIRERVDTVASELVEVRRRLAATSVKDGDRHRDAGRHDEAVECYREAVDFLNATLETARELVPETTDAITEHRGAVERRLSELDADPDGSDPDSAGDSDTADPGESTSVASPT